MNNLLAEVHNSFQVFVSNFLLCKTYIALSQAPGKAGRAVALGQFDFVEHSPDFVRLERGVIKKIDKIFDGPLEVDVVFPEGVVGVDE